MKNRPRKRSARPLLVAVGGVGAAVTLAGCPGGGPFGNLKAPDCNLDMYPQNAQYCGAEDLKTIDMQADAPFGNLKAPEDLAVDDLANTSTDGL